MICAIRAAYRRRFYPNGPWWFKHRFSSIGLIMALNNCTREEADREQALLDHARLVAWLDGY